MQMCRAPQVEWRCRTSSLVNASSLGAKAWMTTTAPLSTTSWTSRSEQIHTVFSITLFLFWSVKHRQTLFNLNKGKSIDRYWLDSTHYLYLKRLSKCLLISVNYCVVCWNLLRFPCIYMSSLVFTAIYYWFLPEFTVLTSI